MHRFLAMRIPFWIVLVALVCALGFGMVGRGEMHASFNDSAVIPPVLPDDVSPIDDLRYGANVSLTNPDVFAHARQELIDQKATFVDADLSRMTITVYESGTSTLTVPIKTKGKPGSWWETPAGLYKIRSKEPNHFSSFGKVNQPWSMAFQGNFFIHGWPTHPDGTPVPQGYSGGCMRLADEDAKAIYDRVRVGTPVLVYEQSFTPDGYAYSARMPKLTASQVLVADVRNNFVFLGSNATTTLPLDGFNRFLTGLVAVEYINIENTLPTSGLASTTRIRLSDPNTTRAFDLLALMLEESDSDPEVAFGDRLGAKRLATLSAEKAKAIGMRDTRVGGEGVTTPMDVFYLMKYVTLNRKFLLEMSRGRLTGSAYDAPTVRGLAPNHPLLAEPGFSGGTFASSTSGLINSAAIFQFEIEGATRPVMIFLGGSTDPVGDTRAIREYILRVY